MNLDTFQDWLSINVGKTSTKNYVNQMKGFFIHYSELTQETLNQYLSSKVDKWSNGSVNCFVKAVKWYMKFTKTQYELPLTKKVETKPRQYLKEPEIDAILEKLPLIFQDWKKVQCVIRLLAYSGMRPKELLTLRRENINIKERKIVLVNTKTFKSRIVFITQELAKNIQSIFEQETEVTNAFNLCDTSIQYYCKRISECLNVKINPYLFRHTFSHMFLKKTNNNLIALSKSLGHARLTTTQLYCDVDENEMQNIFDKAFKKRRK